MFWSVYSLQKLWLHLPVAVVRLKHLPGCSHSLDLQCIFFVRGFLIKTFFLPVVYPKMDHSASETSPVSCLRELSAGHRPSSTAYRCVAATTCFPHSALCSHSPVSSDKLQCPQNTVLLGFFVWYCPNSVWIYRNFKIRFCFINWDRGVTSWMVNPAEVKQWWRLD